MKLFSVGGKFSIGPASGEVSDAELHAEPLHCAISIVYPAVDGVVHAKLSELGDKPA